MQMESRSVWYASSVERERLWADPTLTPDKAVERFRGLTVLLPWLGAEGVYQLVSGRPGTLLGAPPQQVRWGTVAGRLGGYPECGTR